MELKGIILFFCEKANVFQLPSDFDVVNYIKSK